MPLAGNGLPDGSPNIEGVEFGLLDNISSSVTTIGTDDVRGQRSTHYHVTVDKPLRGCETKAGSGSTIPIDVWLDSQGRLTRMQISLFTDNKVPPGFPTPQPQLTSETIVTTIELYDFGVPVSVSAPPAEETQNVPMPSVRQTHGTPSPSSCPTS
jgi:hypothetical protein